MDREPDSYEIPRVYACLKPVERATRLAIDILLRDGVELWRRDGTQFRQANWQNVDDGPMYVLAKYPEEADGLKYMQLDVLRYVDGESIDKRFARESTYNINRNFPGKTIMSSDGTVAEEFQELDDTIAEQLLEILSVKSPELASSLLKNIIDDKFRQLVGHYMLSSHELETELNLINSSTKREAIDKITKLALALFNQSLLKIRTEDALEKQLEPKNEYHGGPLYFMGIRYAINLYLRGGARLDDLRQS